MDTAQKMDQQYRYQRHIYDFSRKYYLFGRDTLLNEIQVKPGETVLEMGCGTARNLLRMAYRSPHGYFYGVDASAMMLEMAKDKIVSSIYADKIKLGQGLAEQIQPQHFNLQQPFDHIVFSYVLSMIPNWQDALAHALSILKPRGQLHIVDFSDQETMPPWFRHLLLQWLAWFHVHPEPQILTHLEQLAMQANDQLNMRHLTGRYALLAHYQKAGESDDEQPELAKYLGLSI